LINEARCGGYAIGYFESWDLPSLQGVLDAVEQTRSPAILGFNGEFLSNPERNVKERLHLYGALGRVAAEAAEVPCGLIFNECSRDPWTVEAMEAGFNLVGIADTNGHAHDYTRRVSQLVKLARRYGAAVEAEVGELPCAASGGQPSGGVLTDPDVAAQFVAETDVDLLAVSVGNIHIQVNGEDEELDLDRLAAIKRRVDRPLVLHGGTGISANSLTAAIELGVVKVNYGTYLKQRCLKAMRRALNADVSNPHLLLGMGGDQDLLEVSRCSVRDAVLERIDLLGCCGRV
jgi:fructose/tagatose bisphosphate aldolase